MPEDQEYYDSRVDTLFHSQRVGELMVQIVKEVLDRSTCHDRSKTQPPEVAVFDEHTPKLKQLKYGSEEYKKSLEEMKPALDHHYANNAHHPEHRPNGVNGMTLVDLIEMLADWKAATERSDSGDLKRSLEINKTRFKMSDQLVEILQNTANHFGWLSSAKPQGEVWAHLEPQMAHCSHRGNNNELDLTRQGVHAPHAWHDWAINQNNEYWCDGSRLELSIDGDMGRS